MGVGDGDLFMNEGFFGLWDDGGIGGSLGWEFLMLQIIIIVRYAGDGLGRGFGC